MNILGEEQIGEGRFSIPLYNLSLSTCIQNTNSLCFMYTVVEISLTKNMERKKNKYREEQIGESRFSIPRYNLSLSTCIPNMKFLSKQFWRYL